MFAEIDAAAIRCSVRSILISSGNTSGFVKRARMQIAQLRLLPYLGSVITFEVSKQKLQQPR